MYGASQSLVLPPLSAAMADVVLRDGSQALTANWDAGAFEIRAETFQSDVATGTAPLIVASATLVSNLNADLLDGNEASAFALASHNHAASDINSGTLAHERGGLETDISAITTGGLLRGTGAGAVGILAIGTDGQVLTAQADGTVDWEDAASGGGDLLADGTVPLTANWDAGSFEIRAQTFESDVTTGTAPLTIASTTLVNNLNADLLDGNEASAFAMASHNHAAGDVTSGTLLHERGGLEADVSAYGGVVLINGGSTSEIKYNMAASSAPTASDDSGSGYVVGSRWIDTTNDKEYVCLDNSSAAAVWTETTGGGGSGIDPSGLTTGDVIYSDSVGSYAFLSVGSDGQVLTLSAGLPSWSTPVDGIDKSGVSTGEIVYASGSGSISWLSPGSDGQVLTLSAGLPAWSTPTDGIDKSGVSTGEIVYASGSGSVSWLSPGSDGQVLVMSAGLPSWQTFNEGIDISGVSEGDILYANGSGSVGWRSIGSTDDILTVGFDGVTPTWTTPTFIDQDGTVELTANWDAGSHRITAETFESDVTTGTAPFVIASTTLVSNLNADLLDDQEGSYYRNATNINAGLLKHEYGGLEFNASAVAIGDIIAGSATGTMALVTSSGHNTGDLLTRQSDGSVDYEEPALPRGYLSGLGMSNNGTDANHDIDIAAGECRDSANGANLELTSTMVKQIDSSWSAGSAAGGLFSGTVAADTWYHVFVIKKDSDGSTDAGFDTSVTAANIPTGYTEYRRIGSVLTDGSANIIGFIQSGNEFRFKTPVYDQNAVTLGTTATNFTVSAPLGIKTKWCGTTLAFKSSTDVQLHVSGPDTDDVNPTDPSTYTHRSPASGQIAIQWGGYDHIWTNTSSQIRARANAASTAFHAATYGWMDERSV